MNYHQLCIAALSIMGYTTDKGGYCQGLTTRWLEASILGEEDAFHARLELMRSLGRLLYIAVRTVKMKQGIGLTEDDRKILDILAFLDSTELYQNPGNKPLLFDKPMYQCHTMELSAYASCDKIEAMGGINKAHSEFGIYSKKELQEYLLSLSTVIDQIVPKIIVRILLSSNHAIALIYEPGAGWTHMDINSYPPKKFLKSQVQKLSRAIFDSIKTKSDYRELYFDFLTTNNDEQLPALREHLANFKAQRHHLLHRQLLRKRDEVNFIYGAAIRGYADIIIELAKLRVDLDRALSDGATPAFIAAENGHAEVIAALATHGADLNKPEINGGTPAFIAAQHGHAEVIAALATHGADLNKPVMTGATPAFIAAHNGHTTVITLLATHGADLNKPTHNGVTPAFIAAQTGHTEVVVELIRLGANVKAPFQKTEPSLREFSSTRGPDVIERMNHFISTKNPQDNELIAVTPYDIAVIMGHQTVVERLQEYLMSPMAFDPGSPSLSEIGFFQATDDTELITERTRAPSA